MALVLDIRNLNVAFTDASGKAHPVVNQMHLSLKRGEILGLAGESGSGKSVTARAIMRLLDPKMATVSAERCDFYPHGNVQPLALHQLPEASMAPLRGKHLAMIFQEPGTALNPVMSCGDQIAEVCLRHIGPNRSQARELSLDLLRQMQLDAPERIYNAFPHQLSGGQKQRVMIAMAMACQPDVLIADEPTTALDVSTQKGILALMQQLREEQGTAILFISHDLNLLSGFADRAAIMQHGHLVEEGSIDQVFQNPQHPYTRALLACRPPLSHRYYRLPVLNDFLSDQGRGTGFQVDHPGNIIQPEERILEHQQRYSNKPLLRVQNLSVGYEHRSGLFSSRLERIHAVDNVSFEMFPGETLGLVGESGSGKSSLGRALVRLGEASEGEIYYGPTCISQLSPSQFRPWRKKIQIVFQDPWQSLNPSMTVGEALMEPLMYHKLGKTPAEARRKAQDLFDKVHLPRNLFAHYPHELSGGQRQRVCIARALTVNPELLICDEAVSALDVSVQAQIINLLQELRRDLGFTCLFISHDIGVVRYMSDRIFVMKHGKIIEQGEADQLCSNPQEPYTKQLLQAIPRFHS